LRDAGKQGCGRVRGGGLIGFLTWKVARGSTAKLRDRERRVSQTDRTREHLIKTYRKKAKRYDFTSRFSPVPGYPEHALRLRAVGALDLHRGDSVVDVACGTGRNFALIEELIGPEGRIVGVDLTDAMLARAEDRIATQGWRNISLVQGDAADFDFPAGVAAILSTYALTQVPECRQVIAHGACALVEGGRWVVLDLKLPANMPRWLLRLGTGAVRPFASIDQWITRRPWEVIRAAMRDELVDLAWDEFAFGTAFLAVGSRGGDE
jgi:ubiquinone/menaquinone biosynthesis C-methylase UbiE